MILIASTIALIRATYSALRGRFCRYRNRRAGRLALPSARSESKSVIDVILPTPDYRQVMASGTITCMNQPRSPPDNR